jgi:hypothetical protein
MGTRKLADIIQIELGMQDFALEISCIKENEVTQDSCKRLLMPIKNKTKQLTGSSKKDASHASSGFSNDTFIINNIEDD